MKLSKLPLTPHFHQHHWLLISLSTLTLTTLATTTQIVHADSASSHPTNGPSAIDQSHLSQSQTNQISLKQSNPSVASTSTPVNLENNLTKPASQTPVPATHTLLRPVNLSHQNSTASLPSSANQEAALKSQDTPTTVSPVSTAADAPLSNKGDSSQAPVSAPTFRASNTNVNHLETTRTMVTPASMSATQPSSASMFRTSATNANHLESTPTTADSLSTPATLPNSDSEPITQWMPNRRLQAEVFKNLNAANIPNRHWDNVNQITPADMTLLTNYRAEDSYIDGKQSYSLKGLEKAVNLTSAVLSDNLNINYPHSTVGYFFGDITDLTPIAGLTKLQYLYCEYNRISDVTPLVHLTNLKLLWLDNNQITDFRPLHPFIASHPELDLQTGDQIIFKKSVVTVNRDDLTATLPSEYYSTNGEKVTLAPTSALGINTRIDENGIEFKSHFYNGAHNSKNDTVRDGHGGLIFHNLIDQPTHNYVVNDHSDPVYDSYYLIGKYISPNAVDPSFLIIQRYLITPSMMSIYYVDQDNNFITDANGQDVETTYLTGALSHAFQFQPLVIPGYKFEDATDQNTENLNQTGQLFSGTYSDLDQWISLAYRPVTGGKITRVFQDTDGHQIAPSQFAYGDVGDSLTFTVPKFAGYQFFQTLPKTQLTQFDAQSHTLIYQYKRQAAPVTIQYLDERNQPLWPALTNQVINGVVGDHLTVDNLMPHVLDGYQTPTVAIDDQGQPVDWSHFIFDDQPHTLTFHYQRTYYKNVVLHYMTSNGDSLHQASELHGFYRDHYVVSPLTIRGYHVQSVQGPTTGYFSSQAHRINYIYQANPGGSVTVNYLDEDGQQLSLPQILRGLFGESYTSAPINRAGYTPTQIQGITSGRFTNQPQSVIYIYHHDLGAAVITHYQDTVGNELHPEQVTLGLFGNTYQTTPLTFLNYQVSQVTGPTHGTFSATPHHVYYVYCHQAGHPITVKYQNERGQSLHPDIKLPGQLATPYATQPLSFDGYTLKTIEGRPTGVFTHEAQTVTYVYSRNAGKAVTVVYVDEAGKTIHDHLELDGKLTAPYVTQPLALSGYTFKTTYGQSTGVFTNEPKIVTYVYSRNAGKTVTVAYVDETGKTIHAPIELNGTLAAPYVTQPLTLSDYTFKTIQGQSTGVFTNEAQTITYVYTRNLGKTVTAKYVDENGNAIHDTVSITGKLGATYTTRPLAVAGYTFKNVIGNPSGTFSNEAQTVTYVYTKNQLVTPVVTGTLTVHYVTESGQILKTPTSLNGTVGTSYQTNSLKFDGYQLTAQPANANGRYTADHQDVTYIYRALGQGVEIDPVNPETPAKKPQADAVMKPSKKPIQPTTSTISAKRDATHVKAASANIQVAKPANAQPAKAVTTDEQLPQNDEQSSSLTVLLGSLLSLVTVFGLFSQRRKNKE